MRSKIEIAGALLLPAALVLTPLLVTSCAVSSEETGASASAESTELCGNGVRDPGEQCDDGNRTPLDGCSATCQFEQFQRVNKIEILFATDAFCRANALGGAISSEAQSKLQEAVGDAVAQNKVNVLFSLDGLTDLTGQTAATLSLGSFVADPSPGASVGLDAWYTVQGDSVGADGTAVAQLPAQLATGGALTAGPGNFAFALAIGGTQAKLAVSGTKAKAKIGASSAPKPSTNGRSPGHLPVEQIDPALKSFATTTTGQLCGNISAASLATVRVPEELQSGSSTACSEGYTRANSMLDVLVSGCSVFIITAITATQPDKSDPGLGAAGGGAPYTLSAGENRKVNGCKDKNGRTVSLSACLKSAAYSAAFKFNTQRVIVKGTTN
jgi:cysteine-rich repeat protein